MSDEFEIDDQLYKQLATGHYLQTLRKDLGPKCTLMYVSKQLDITHPYLMDLEKGLKTPSDALLSRIAKFYKLNEDDLFQRYGKVPILAQKEVADNKFLQDTLAEVARDNRLTDERKERLYQNIYETYSNFIKEIEDDEMREGKCKFKGDKEL
jgi:transcriptional regulator with XRE-family HTH domain